MLFLIPVVAVGAVAAWRWHVNKTQTTVLTPERRAVYTYAMTVIRDPVKLTAMANVFSKEGLSVQADNLKKRASLTTVSPKISGERQRVAKLALRSTNPNTVNKVAIAFEQKGAGATASMLRNYANGLQIAGEVNSRFGFGPAGGLTNISNAQLTPAALKKKFDLQQAAWATHVASMTPEQLAAQTAASQATMASVSAQRKQAAFTALAASKATQAPAPVPFSEKVAASDTPAMSNSGAPTSDDSNVEYVDDAPPVMVDTAHVETVAPPDSSYVDTNDHTGTPSPHDLVKGTDQDGSTSSQPADYLDGSVNVPVPVSKVPVISTIRPVSAAKAVPVTTVAAAAAGAVTGFLIAGPIGAAAGAAAGYLGSTHLQVKKA